MQRALRQQKILEIISNMEIETQEELCEELNKQNFRVTQATISRDVNEMKLYKVAGTHKKYKYASLATDVNNVEKMTNLYKECVIGVKCANNIICIQTIRANAPNVCAFVDSLKIDEIIGSLAGDDTLLLIVENNESTPKVLEILDQYLI